MSVDPRVALDRIGRFEIIDRLGAGGMAEVLLAVRRAEGFSRAVALKRVLPALASQTRFRTMMRREAQLAALVHHPNCIEIQDLEESDVECALVMELLHGVDAAELVRGLRERGSRLAPSAVVRIVCDAARGLHHVHELRDADGEPLAIVHRDISPHNLFVTDSGVAKVLDFGIAKAALETDEVTRTGVLKGKFRYMAPEQLVAGDLDARTDVYALAITTWEMLAGAPLFESSPLQAVERARFVSEVSLRTRPESSSLPPALLDVLERALRHEPSHRTGSMQAFHDALLAACAPASHEDVASRVLEVAADRIRERRDLIRRATAPRVGASVPPPESSSRSGRDTLRLDDEATRRVVGTSGPRGAPIAAPSSDATAAGKHRRVRAEEPARPLDPTQPASSSSNTPEAVAPHEAPGSSGPRAEAPRTPTPRARPVRDTLAEHSPGNDRPGNDRPGRERPGSERPRSERPPRAASVPPASRATMPVWELVLFGVAMLVGAGLAYWIP